MLARVAPAPSRSTARPPGPTSPTILLPGHTSASDSTPWFHSPSAPRNPREAPKSQHLLDHPEHRLHGGLALAIVPSPRAYIIAVTASAGHSGGAFMRSPSGAPRNIRLDLRARSVVSGIATSASGLFCYLSQLVQRRLHFLLVVAWLSSPLPCDCPAPACALKPELPVCARMIRDSSSVKLDLSLSVLLPAPSAVALPPSCRSLLPVLPPLQLRFVLRSLRLVPLLRADLLLRFPSLPPFPFCRDDRTR